MNTCPNCNAALDARPCSACGWPETTAEGRPEGFLGAQSLRPTASETSTESGGGCCSLALAMAATAGTVAFYKLGEAAHWTSDGPAALFLYLGTGICGLVAILTWFGIVYGTVYPYLPRWLRWLLDLVVDQP